MIDSAAATLPECLASNTAYLLVRSARQLHERMERALEPFNVRPRHYSVLAVLSSMGSISQQRLGEILQIDRTTMVAVIDELEKIGYVERRRDPADRRAYRVDLTPAGQTARQELRQVVDATQAKFFGRLSDHDRADLQRILRRFLCDSESP